LRSVSHYNVLTPCLKVQGEAQGEKSALDKLKKDLNEGPSAAQVVKLETSEIATKDGESEFKA
jgi:acylphosphatase